MTGPWHRGRTELWASGPVVRRGALARELEGPDLGVGSGWFDQTRSDHFLALKELSGNDRTLACASPVVVERASLFMCLLCAVMTGPSVGMSSLDDQESSVILY